MNNKPLITIFLIAFIDLMGFGLILPLLPFIAEEFHANPLEIGLLSTAYSLFQFLAAPVLGRLSDRYGRKKLLVISQLGSTVGFLLLGVANSLPILFLSRIIDGITGGNISIAQAYIADVTTKDNRAKGMGIIGAAFGLGFIFGPAIGGTLFRFGFAVPAFFAAGVSFLSVLATAIFLKETVNTSKQSIARKPPSFSFRQLKHILSQQPLGLLIIVFFLINLAFSGLQGTFALWTEDTYGWGPTQTGYIFTYIGILSVLTQLKILSYFTGRLGDSGTLKTAVPLLAIGLLLIPLSLHLAILLAAMAILVLGNGLSNPTIQAIASENVHQDEYGGTLGFLHSSASLGRIFGPVLAGELYRAISKDAPYISSGIILVLTVFLIQRYLPSSKNFWQRLTAIFSPKSS